MRGERYPSCCQNFVVSLEVWKMSPRPLGTLPALPKPRKRGMMDIHLIDTCIPTFSMKELALLLALITIVLGMYSETAFST